MSNFRPICENTEQHSHNHAHRMKPVKNSVKIQYAENSIQMSDRYKCDECGQTILTGLAKPHRSENKTGITVKK